MPTYQIEMLWKCAQCGHSPNRGLARHCIHCGFPKNDKCEEFFPDDISPSNAIRGDQLRLALAGADWKCKFCGSLQSRASAFCSECGCNMETGEKPWQAKVKTVVQDVHTGSKREDVSDEDVRVWKPSRESEPEPDPEPYRPKPKSAGRQAEFTFHPYVRSDPPPLPTYHLPWAKIGIAAGTVVVLGLLLWLVFRTKVVEADVTAVTWEYRVHIDRYQVWRREGWHTDNGAFDVHNEGQRIHHYDKVVSGSHQESYQESYSCGETCTTTPRFCTSNRNGSATCSGGDRSCSPKTCSRTAYKTVTDYKDEPRYQAWYSWSVWDWGFNRTVTRSGADMEPGWPAPEQLIAPLREGERERQRREEVYRVIWLASDAKTYTLEPKTRADFMQFPRGRHARLKVGIAHGVEVLAQ